MNNRVVKLCFGAFFFLFGNGITTATLGKQGDFLERCFHGNCNDTKLGASKWRDDEVKRC